MRTVIVAVVAVAVLAACAGSSAAPAPNVSRADECLRQPAFKSMSLLLHGRSARMGPNARRACGGAYPIVLSIIANYWTCDWGPGSSPRYTTRPGGC